MNLLDFIQKELYAAWREATNPLFPDGPVNDYFYTEQFNYYQSLKGKTIDTNRGESLFLAGGDHLHITKIQRHNLSEVSAPADFQARNWKPV